MAEACCTCASLLADITPLYDEKTEKPSTLDRRLECCNRIICGPCIFRNPRFGTYCPFCQISTAPNPLPAEGLRNAPSYTKATSNQHFNPPSYTDTETDSLPPYSTLTPLTHTSEKSSSATTEDVLHFIDHSIDTLPGIALRYNVPITALRRTNGLTSDHLLGARRTILVPGEFYKGGVSLSPRPVEGEEEEVRRGKVRRWMVAVKCAEYDVALLYLKQTDYDLDAAVEAYKDDERWEKEHPIEANVKGKGKKHDLGKRRFTGQRS